MLQVDIEHLQHSMVKQPSPSNDPGSKDHPAGVHRRKASIIAPPSAPLKEKQHTEATTVQQGQSEEVSASWLGSARLVFGVVLLLLLLIRGFLVFMMLYYFCVHLFSCLQV